MRRLSARVPPEADRGGAGRDLGRALLRPRLRVRDHAALVADPRRPDAAWRGRGAVPLLVAWWAWIYTTWTTNWFDPDAGPVRVVLVVGMLAGMLGAIAIPEAFGDRALLGAIWFAGAFADGRARVAIWLVALALDYAGPLVGHCLPRLGRSDPREWELEPSHFAERLMLFLIIAVGETIVAVGVTASDLSLSAARLLAVVVAFLMSVALWWLYFDFHAERMLAELKGAQGERGAT